MMRYIKSVVVLAAVCLYGVSLFADNLRLTKEVRVVSATDQSMELEVSLSWNNSWRSAVNSDAVYLFGKYKVSGTSEWRHLYFSATSSDHSSDAAVELLPVNGGRGLFVHRSQEGSGPMTATLRLKANPKGNTSYPFTASDISSGRVLFSIQGIEMVLVPNSSFYAGDKSASGAFSGFSFGTILPGYDLINTTSGYTYSSNGSESSYANRAADRYSQGVYNASSRRDWCGTAFPATWQVDFKTPKTILYFGVSGVSGVSWGGFPPVPAGTWFLEGSENGTSWTPVWSGDPAQWGQSTVSYPVKAIRVETPGSYRYYRIRVDDNQCATLWNNIRISNVGMTEQDLSALPSAAPLYVSFENAALPATYPTGFYGFYAMKYELSQEQYVTFLNMLPRPAQYGRTAGGLLDGLREGEYIFGSNHTASSFRNGIILKKKNPNTELPYLFACNVAETDLDNSGKDGQVIACNYLSPSDMLAYAEWSGLRPLSELEYEKMCRGSFPEEPQEGAFAWETPLADPLTDIVLSGEEKEGVPESSTANTNLGSSSNSVSAPVRVGLFVRPGAREHSGLSYWGISDLTGNLSEIYCNAEVYGRQLNRTVHGGGQLTQDGSHSASAANWPREEEAYGVRGSDYATSVQAASAFDRSRAADYFTGMDQRLPTTGVRLGFSIEPVQIVTQLTLENGLRSSSTLVYDTICASGVYSIRGDKHGAPNTPAVYSWYESTDNGTTWQLLEETGRDLSLQNLISRVPANTVKQFRYKRSSTGIGNISETGSICLVVAYGYTVDRLTDTVRACMVSKGFQINVPLSSTFEWKYMESGKQVSATSTALTSAYTVRLAELRTEEDEFPGGDYYLNVKVNTLKKCTNTLYLKVHVAPNTVSPFTKSEEAYTYGTNTYALNERWGGTDRQQWSIVGGGYGNLTINESTGVLSGMSTTFLQVVVQAVCLDYPDQKYLKKLSETTRTYLYTGAEQSLILPVGSYNMECWGADGGYGYGNSNPIGYGGYTKGTIAWSSVRTCYMYVGEYGNGVNVTRGFNGGGQAPGTSGHNGGRGGGATDVRLTGGSWDNTTSLRSRIMVAGGGGGAQPSCGGSATTAGHAGGLTGTTSLNTAGYYVNNRSFGGSQTAGGSFQLGSNASNNGVVGSFGVGAYANSCAGGGGSGWYGGGSLYTSGGGGGSSFISGHTGCDAVNSSGAHTGQSVHFSNLAFTNTVLKGGAEVPSRGPNGYGKIVITFVGNL